MTSLDLLERTLPEPGSHPHHGILATRGDLAVRLAANLDEITA